MAAGGVFRPMVVAVAVAIVSAVGCLGGGCVGDPVRNWLELIGVLAYNLGPAYWLWRRSGTPIPQ